MFYEEGNSTSDTSWMIIFYCIITLNSKIYFLGKGTFRLGQLCQSYFLLDIIQVPYVLIWRLGNSKTERLYPWKQTSDACHERWPTGEVLFRGFRLFGDNLVSCARGADRFRYGWWFSEFGSCSEFEWGFTFVKGGLGFRGGGGADGRSCPMASNRLIPVMLTPKWFLAASETLWHKLDFLSIASWVGLA